MENIPKTIRTPRLLLRAPQAGDGAIINAGVRESFDRLQRFLPWAQTIPTLQESEDRILNEIKRWNAKENLQILVFNSTETESKIDKYDPFTHIPLIPSKFTN